MSKRGNPLERNRRHPPQKLLAGRLGGLVSKV
jgi:hypothetical protein